MSLQSVAFIGLGAMGWHMASHLPKKFTDVRVWNRNFSKAEAHAAQFKTTASTLEAVLEADVIFSCLPTSHQVEVLISQFKPKAGSIWVDCTSGEPEAARRLASLLSAHQVDFLDAPVSGQTIGAEHGTLTVMVGGCKDALLKALPAIECFSGLVEHVGESGSGFAVKAVNNVLMATNLWALGEGMCNLKSHGVNLDSALKCINASSGQSGMSQSIFAQRVLSQQFPLTFALNLLAKDAKIATDLGRERNMVMPLLQLTQQMMRTASQNLPDDSDFSSAIKMLERWNDLNLQSHQ